jgi:hypothetical protein
MESKSHEETTDDSPGDATPLGTIAVEQTLERRTLRDHASRSETETQQNTETTCIN